MSAVYNYEYLKKSAESHTLIGSWGDVGVYSCRAKDYDPSSRYYYVIYNDNNKLVREGIVYATMDKNGSLRKLIPYKYEAPQVKREEVKIPATAYSASVSNDDFFSRIDREINELLASIKDGRFQLVEY